MGGANTKEKSKLDTSNHQINPYTKSSTETLASPVLTPTPSLHALPKSPPSTSPFKHTPRALTFISVSLSSLSNLKSMKKTTLMDPISSNLPPRKLRSNLSVQIQFPDDERTEEEEKDDFRMYEFKVRRCARARSHDWTDCPFAHPGEKARRRDPRKYHYAATGCPDYKSRGGDCPRGDGCEFAHGVFECWMHPARYRTTPCKDGRGCRRKVCFFAHTRRQLRVLTSTSAESSPSSPSMFLSPTSTLVGFGASPPVSPPPMGGCGKGRRRPGKCSFGELVSQLEAMDISPAVTGSGIIGTGGDTERGYYAPDLDWVDELLE